MRLMCASCDLPRYRCVDEDVLKPAGCVQGSRGFSRDIILLSD